MAITALQAAKTICQWNDWGITHLALQKLLYFSHVFYVGEYNQDSDVVGDDVKYKLINEKFEPWELGPVVRNVYSALKKSKGGDIDESFFTSVPDLDKATPEYEIINDVCDMLKNYTAGELVVLSHDDKGAWIRNIDKEYISNKEIYDEYNRRISNG